LYATVERQYDERAVCAAVNEALIDLDTSPIVRLGETLGGEARCVCTLPLLDPYDRYRAEPVIGPHLTTPIVDRDRAAQEIFCYLREAPGSRRLDDLAGALLGLPRQVRAFIPGISANMASRLRSDGVDVLQGPAPLAMQLRRSRVVVHFGGHGIAAAALLAGVPQVIVDFDIEKYLIANALTAQGVAVRLDYYQSSPDALRAAVFETLSNSETCVAADHVAAKNARYRSRDVASTIADTCLRAVG
jgi:hypothetical protein